MIVGRRWCGVCTWRRFKRLTGHDTARCGGGGRFVGLDGFDELAIRRRHLAAFALQQFDPYRGRAGTLEAEQLRATSRHVDDPATCKRAAVVDTDLQRAAIVQIRDPDDARQGQGSVRGADLVHVEDFAIGGLFAVKLRPIPGCDSGFAIAVIDLRVVPDTIDFVGVADLVPARRRVFLLRRFGRSGNPFCGRDDELGFGATGDKQC